jgi:hypothetical protein
VLTVLLLAAAAWMFVRYPGVLVSGVANPDPKGHVDFETFWRSTAALLHGGDIYHTGSVLPNLNPPLLSLLLAPFGLLPVMPSYWLFTACTLVLVTVAVVAAARELGLGRGATWFGVLTLWASSPLHGTLLLGQIYGLLLAGLTAAWLADRRGHPVWSVLLVALVVGLKPSLAPLLLLPLVHRRRRELAVGIGAAAGFSLAGVLVAGPASALEWLHLATGTPAPEVDANASLPGLVARLGGPGQAGWVITVVVVITALVWARGHRGQDPVPRGTVGPRDVLLFEITAGCLVAAPIAWLNYWVMLWPGALALLRAGRGRIAVPLLVAPIVPVAWGNLWQAAPHAPLSLAGRSLYTVVLLGFWVALGCYALSSERPSGPVAGRRDARADVPVGGSGEDRAPENGPGESPADGGGDGPSRSAAGVVDAGASDSRS